MKEPEIKLFGRKIQLPENTGEVPGGECSDVISDQDHVIPAEEDNQKPNETEESQKPNTPSREESGENPKTPSIVEEDNPKSETEQSNSPNEQQKTLKKPDKILPCPRCSSMDTKFCYYNNYNINQPRHFCKGCQRYWTAGGTMRNVPVGSGRRKNKNSSSHSNHITINEAALQASRIVDAAHNGFHHQSFTPNGTVLSFGPDSQLCESMSSGSTPEKRAVKNGFYTVDQIGLTSCKKEGKKDNCSVGSSNGFPSHVPYVPWTFPWNAYPVPTFYHPQPYWNCAWNVPWLPIPNQNSPPNSSSSLGKHSRNGELLKPNDLGHKEKEEKKSLESSIVVPKTLRIDDPEEAAKSSIWETLGIKYDSAQREGLFKALQHKCDEKKSIVSNSSVLHANPAALSRSITFQEGV